MEHKQIVLDILDKIGVQLNGPRPYDIHVKNEGVYKRWLTEGDMGLGESYMDGWWECEAIDEVIYRILKADLEKIVGQSLSTKLYILSTKIFNHQTKEKAKVVGRQHYDLGNDLFRAMLDKWMMYSSGYWRNAKNLEEAQEAKLDMICRKLELKPGKKVLDIGCGWGGFAKYAAEKYGVEVLGVTISKEQAAFAKEYCKDLPVEIRLQDYRDVTGEFDAVLSIGFFEHVGYKNYRTYMKLVDSCLKDDGVSLLHTIGSNISLTHTGSWTNKYIFPNGMLPSIAQIGKAVEGIFVIEDIHNFGEYYDKTLMAWNENFEKAWPDLKSKYNERFYRMWRYYLLSSAGGFRARSNQLWQIVLTKPGRKQPDCRIV